ncbi:DNA-binding transcriptional regulator, MerR family [Nocardioides exalbidus]|uniref:DNA-binding transcriptional regulator, MerR family n=1 Tax=Nocardioides exalbidus TaxID=402596 RepID=A0A1H4NCW9_9ACTN|nr:MerR family transcriptional regulator [Nocardioides exalbidus]SEB93093.1 DNA-binding transcriptional regulator, MerR family [Nocardioides exalbidus]
MRIGELAERAGVSVRSLRYYEEQGLLVSERSASGQRHYVEGDVDHVVFLQRMYAAGLSSRTILELMPCATAPSQENSDAAFDRLLVERDRIDAHIEELIRTREALDTLVDLNRAHRDSLPASAAG